MRQDDFDLPIPDWNKADLSVDAVARRQWTVFRSLCLAAAIYAFFHKVLVPALLMMTPLADTVYAKVDPWGLVATWFGIYIYRSHRVQGVGAEVLAGLVLGRALWDLFKVSTGAYQGWLTISALVAAAPLAAASAYLILIKSSFFKLRFSVSGLSVVMGVGLSALMLHFFPSNEWAGALRRGYHKEPTGVNKICGTKVHWDADNKELIYDFKYCEEKK